MAVASPDTTPAGAIPSLAQTRALAADYNLIPVRETFIDDCQTPVSAFLKLRGSEPSFLLESADQGRVGRYSFIGFRPRKVLRWSLGDPGDPYALAAAELTPLKAAPLPELPPFAGGAVGLFAYDRVSHQRVWQAGVATGASQARELHQVVRTREEPRRRSAPLDAERLSDRLLATHVDEDTERLVGEGVLARLARAETR